MRAKIDTHTQIMDAIMGSLVFPVFRGIIALVQKINIKDGRGRENIH